ncbi:hypothetical protein STENM327S_01319 [Streptomyces tendae]
MLRHATRHGTRTWHVAGPAAVVGGMSIPLALYMGSPTATVAVITVTACAIFAALPVFWSVPSRFLTGAAAAAGIALINTAGNVAGFASSYITGWLKDWSGAYYLPLYLSVGFFMLLSAALMILLAARNRTDEPAPLPPPRPRRPCDDPPVQRPGRLRRRGAGGLRHHRRWVRPVTGGVVRATATPAGQVAVVIGGGSATTPRSPAWSAAVWPTARPSGTSRPRPPPGRSTPWPGPRTGAGGSPADARQLRR